jgi:hypothetical protein
MDEKTKSELRTLATRMLVLLDGGSAGATTAAPRSTAGAVADDRELDSDKGDPVIRRDPKRWQGPSYVGKHYSECPADYLLTLADFKEWSAANPRPDADPKYADYDRRDAARARGWAKRNANGVRRSGGGVDRDEIPAGDFGGVDSDTF